MGLSPSRLQKANRPMTAIDQPRDSLPSRFNASAVSFVAAIGGFLFGYDLGLIAVTNIYLKEQFHLSTEEFGWVTASAGWGCMLGPILGAWLCDALGRKTTMIIAAMLLAVGAVLTAVPDVAPGMSDEATMLVFKVFARWVDWAWVCVPWLRLCSSPRRLRAHGAEAWA